MKSESRVYYDGKHRRLVYIGQPADERFWDIHWADSTTSSNITRYNHFVARETARHLERGSKILDGGCGLAHTVFSLDRDGFEAYGVDYAPETVARVNALVPRLRVTVGDVRNLTQFPDSFFDGYWSLGVIEHFYEGCSEVLAEMRRIVRPMGYAFVTVPSMSPLRNWKARHDQYESFDGNPSRFYQFALQPRDVISEFEKFGFRFLEARGRGGLKGLKDELRIVRPFLQRVFDSRSIGGRAVKAAIDSASNAWAYHTRFYLFQRES
jgi:ubiquinone/menaquinone biosynthesis C-methylase UbiE